MIWIRWLITARELVKRDEPIFFMEDERRRGWEEPAHYSLHTACVLPPMDKLFSEGSGFGLWNKGNPQPHKRRGRREARVGLAIWSPGIFKRKEAGGGC